jgi:hypothetical protein
MVLPLMIVIKYKKLYDPEAKYSSVSIMIVIKYNKLSDPAA